MLFRSYNINSNADLLVATTAYSVHVLSSPNIIEVTDSARFACSVFAKYAGTQYVQLSVANGVYANFDLINGTVLNKTATDASIKPNGDGWWLLEIRSIATTFGTAPQLQVLEQILYDFVNNNFGTSQYALVPEGVTRNVNVYLLDSSQNQGAVISQIINVVSEFFSPLNRQMGENVYVSDLRRLIQNENGVITLSDIQFINNEIGRAHV